MFNKNILKVIKDLFLLLYIALGFMDQMVLYKIWTIKKPLLIHKGFFIFGRGSRTRTLTNGFGDRHATITPILYNAVINSFLT